MRISRKRIIWTSILFLFLVIIMRSCFFSEEKDRAFIRDQEGRALVLHGFNINSSAKSDSLRIGKTTKEDYYRLSEEWGMNFVRILVLWDGIEPEAGKYDTAYFKRINERLDWCQEAGLYAVLDMHQDLYSIRYGGDGAPDWAIRDNGEPFEMQSPWEKNYLQPAVIASIRNFWMPENGHEDLQEHFVDAFKELVVHTKGHPALLGYDLYNEPVLATLQLFKFEDKYLHPFYQKLIDGIRTVDNDSYLFFEPMAIGPNQSFRSGLNPLNDPREGEQKLVYFPHVYTLDLDLSGKYIGFPLFTNAWSAKRKRETRKHEAPMLIGEFGLDNNNEKAVKYIEEVMRLNEKIGSGWAYWDYGIGGSWNPLDKDLNEKPMLDALVRPFPHCVAGDIISYGYKPEKEIFWLQFRPDPDITSPTIIYIPERSFTGGWTFGKDAPKEGTYSWDEKSRKLSIDHAGIDGIFRIEIVSK